VAGICTDGVDTGFAALGYAKVAFLGVVQGITELLPVSSTAHMRLVPALLGWQDPGSAFSAAMQLAALAAVVTYFWSDVRGITVGSLRAVGQRDWRSSNLRLALAIAVATVPIVIAGVLLGPVLNACGSPLRTLPVIGVACLVMGALLALAEIYRRQLFKPLAQVYKRIRRPTEYSRITWSTAKRQECAGFVVGFKSWPSSRSSASASDVFRSVPP